VPGQDISLVTGTYYYVPHTQPGVPSHPGQPLCNLTVPVINEPEAIEPVGSDCGISSTTGSGQTHRGRRKWRPDETTARPKNTSRKKHAKANEQASGDLPQAAAVCGVGPSALAHPSVVHDANVIHSGMRAEDSGELVPDPGSEAPPPPLHLYTNPMTSARGSGTLGSNQWIPNFRSSATDVWWFMMVVESALQPSELPVLDDVSQLTKNPTWSEYLACRVCM